MARRRRHLLDEETAFKVAQRYCLQGRDQDGLEKLYIDDFIGKNLIFSWSQTFNLSLGLLISILVSHIKSQSGTPHDQITHGKWMYVIISCLQSCNVNTQV